MPVVGTACTNEAPAGLNRSSALAAPLAVPTSMNRPSGSSATLRGENPTWPLTRLPSDWPTGGADSSVLRTMPGCPLRVTHSRRPSGVNARSRIAALLETLASSAPAGSASWGATRNTWTNQQPDRYDEAIATMRPSGEVRRT